MKYLNPHEVEKLALEWIAVITAITLAIISAVALLWAKWKAAMKDLLETHAESMNKKQVNRERKQRHDNKHTDTDSD